jgi:hypothetical protein
LHARACVRACVCACVRAYVRACVVFQKDPRHFKSWYGLGTIYHRQQKQALAEYHFRKAIAINPYNTVLHVYLGIVLLAKAVSDDGDAGAADGWVAGGRVGGAPTKTDATLGRV